MADHIELKKGDNDDSKKWGGKTLKETPFYTVTNLQEDLKAAGTYTEKEDGDFGNKTEKALKIFQWACANIDACIKNGARAGRVKKATIQTSGKLTKATYDELAAWVKNKQIATGDLVRVAFSALDNVEAGPGFKKVDSGKVKKGEIVISKAALDMLKDMNKKAKDKKVTIKVNQALRVHGIKVTGAVVAPATKSQHLIGHAIDCNIVDGDNWNNSKAFKDKKATKNAKELIAALKKEGYRWGGDFSTPDTPHFDDKLDSTSFAYDAKFYLNQRVISEGHDIPKETV